MPIHAIPRMQLKELTVSGTWRAKEKNLTVVGFEPKTSPLHMFWVCRVLIHGKVDI